MKNNTTQKEASAPSAAEIAAVVAAYTKFVQKPEFKHDRMVSLCPFHDDRKPSFSVDLKTGKFVCFACGKAGNYVSFRAELDGTSNADAYKKILREHGVDETKKEPAKPKSYTVEDYAAEKKRT